MSDLNTNDPNNEQDKEIRLDELADSSQEQSKLISESLNFSQTQDYLKLAHEHTDNQAKQTLILTVACGVLSFLFLSTLAMWSAYPKTKVVPVLDATAICEVTPDNNPALTDQAVSNFAQMAVLHTNSFSFADHQEKIEWAMSNFYTQTGRAKAVGAIRNLGLLEVIEQEMFTIKSHVNGLPSVANIENDGNNKKWTVKIPIQISVFGATKTPLEVQDVLATATVVAHTASKTNPTGLAIDDVRYLRTN